MKKYISIITAVVLVGVAAYVTLGTSPLHHARTSVTSQTDPDIGSFHHQKRCARSPRFLKQKGIPQPVLIDLSQKEYTGIALLYGHGFKQALHPKSWERFEHLGTYAVDKKGNIFLAPMPFISISPSTFSYQQNIYRLDSDTGALSVWMHLSDIHPGANNPFGIISLVYDCDDHTLWVSAIDKSDYQTQKGRIYHIDIASKSILDTYEGFDALTLSLLHTQKGKYLLAGSARDNGVYAFALSKGHIEKPVQLFTLPDTNLHVRKIKHKGKNLLELQAIPFTYTLIVQTDTEDRTYYLAHKNDTNTTWNFLRIN
jgi:hypothetical protein